MRAYDLVLVMRPSLSEADRKKFLETVKGWLGESKITKEDEWGQKVLSYPIKKEQAGFYIQLSIETEALPLDFNKRLLQSEHMLRQLVIRRK